MERRELRGRWNGCFLKGRMHRLRCNSVGICVVYYFQLKVMFFTISLWRGGVNYQRDMATSVGLDWCIVSSQLERRSLWIHAHQRAA